MSTRRSIHGAASPPLVFLPVYIALHIRMNPFGMAKILRVFAKPDSSSWP